MTRHIVMWNVAGATSDEKRRNIERLQDRFHRLCGRIPGLLRLEIGIDRSGIDYACDVVLDSEFEAEAALLAYARHPEHLKVRDELAGVCIARHHVDYEAPCERSATAEIG